MSFPGEIMDLYAEGAARMTAAINEKKNDSRTSSQPLWKCQDISFASLVRVLSCTMLNVMHAPSGHTVITIITK